MKFGLRNERVHGTEGIALLTATNLTLFIYTPLPDGKIKDAHGKTAAEYTNCQGQPLAVDACSPSPVKILFLKEISLHKHFKGTDKELYSILSSTLYRLLEDFQKEAPHQKIVINNLHIFYAEPFGVCSVRNMDLVHEKKMTLSEEIIESFTEKQEKEFLNELSHIKTKANTSKYILIERHLTSTLIDGYPVKNYFLRSYNTFSGRIILGAVRGSLAEKFNDVTTHAVPKSEIFHHTLDAAVIQEATSIIGSTGFLYVLLLPTYSRVYYIKDGTPQNSAIVLFGGDKILSTVAQALKSTTIVTVSHASLYKKGKLNHEDELHFQSAMETAARSWLTEILSTLKMLGNEILLPKILYVSGASFIDELLFDYIIQSGEKLAAVANQRHLRILEGSSKNRFLQEKFTEPSSLLRILFTHCLNR